jgi:ABC-type Fe3+-hydroxamate transport system substrate-binding protein
MNATLGRRRLRALGAAIAATAIGLSGCGSTSTTETAPDSQGGDAFPFTIESALGRAEIPQRPERIVTLGQGSAETAIALGQTLRDATVRDVPELLRTYEENHVPASKPHRTRRADSRG